MRLDTVWRPLLALFGGFPSRSWVELSADVVRFRFGWLFDEAVPRAEVGEVTPGS